jgi:hypothetical protein
MSRAESKPEKLILKGSTKPIPGRAKGITSNDMEVPISAVK